MDPPQRRTPDPAVVGARLSDLLARYRDEIVERATDWVIAQALDLRGQRPRHETQRLVDKVFQWNEALLLRQDAQPLHQFIDFVTAYRAASEFRVSTLLKGFLSFRIALAEILKREEADGWLAFELISCVDQAYFTAIFLMSDEYVRKLNAIIVERRGQLEAELEQATAQRMSELKEKMDIIFDQQAQLSRVSLPVLRVWEGVLVLPLIGELHRARGQEMAERLLAQVVAERATTIIIDITGLGSVDAVATLALVKTLQAVRLVGARGMIVGVSAAAAKALVAVGADLQQIRTFATLADGLRAALGESMSMSGLPTPSHPARVA